MDFSAVEHFVGVYGFPIAAYLLLFWELRKVREEHAVESERWVEALNNNTRVMERLEAKLND